MNNLAELTVSHIETLFTTKPNILFMAHHKDASFTRVGPVAMSSVITPPMDRCTSQQLFKLQGMLFDSTLDLVADRIIDRIEAGIVGMANLRNKQIKISPLTIGAKDHETYRSHAQDVVSSCVALLAEMSGIAHSDAHTILAGKCVRIMKEKNADYAGFTGESSERDPLANFRQSSKIGVDSLLGLLNRTLDKVSRLRSYRKRGKLEVKGEGPIDAISDIMNYMVLAMGFVMEYVPASSNRNPDYVFKP